MTFLQLAEVMWPYWAFGVIMVAAVLISKQRHVMRVDLNAVKNWALIIAGASVLRLALFFTYKATGLPTAWLAAKVNAANVIPLSAVATVFWEDALNCLSLILLSKIIPWKWLNKLILIVFMLFFGLGHLYQGAIAALMIMVYIPLSIAYGKKYGVGTVMLCHILYDLGTLSVIKLVAGCLK